LDFLGGAEKKRQTILFMKQEDAGFKKRQISVLTKPEGNKSQVMLLKKTQGLLTLAL